MHHICQYNHCQGHYTEQTTMFAEEKTPINRGGNTKEKSNTEELNDVR